MFPPPPNQFLAPARAFWIFAALCAATATTLGQSSAPPPARLMTRAGAVEIRRAAGTIWAGASEYQPLFYNDRLRTAPDGQATLQLQDYSQLRVGPRSELALAPGNPPPPQSRIQFQSGQLYFLDRNRPREIEVETPVGSAAINGTEFGLTVDPVSGATVLTLVDGKVTLANAQGQVDLRGGEQGVIERNQAPRKTAVISSQDAVQWCLYYPGVLDPDELGLDASAQNILADSITAYRQGDLLAALAQYPSNRIPATSSEAIFKAALQLSSGGITNYHDLIDNIQAHQPNALALRWLAAAVRHEEIIPPPTPANASQSVAVSYYRQSRHDLAGALTAARRAVALSPKFGFAWERIAELQFSFGRVAEANDALSRALQFSPRNAQAHALHGFLLLAQDHRAEAEAAFSRAIEIDPMLGNAWLGRGLGRIHAGRVTEGRADLQTAAILEPSRWLLRNYLGKAYAEESLHASGPDRRRLHDLALRELDLASRNDPLDPTPWLYSSLIQYNDYQIAQAIADLEKSEALNDNRQVYRSRLLLDQDQAVRSANLADIYKDAGMIDVSLDEAARAVAFDYANFSAHLNLASTFDELRDPTRFNLRYESEWFNETLLAGLLAPPGAISLSENLSQQEYSRLFSHNAVGLESTSEYFSDKDYRNTTTQYGNVDGLSWALDLYYQDKNGIRVNNGLSQIDWDSHIKEQITPKDSLYLMTTYEDYNAGDQFQYYDQSEASSSYRLTETQTPMVLGGWHHEWGPDSHTLFLAGRLQDAQQLTATNSLQQAATINPTVTPGSVPLNLNYNNQFVVYTAELNQIVEHGDNTDIFGARYQNGIFQASALLNNPPPAFGSFSSSSATDSHFQRITPYAYHHWEIVDDLMLIGGLAYDYEQYPVNYRRPPLNNNDAWKGEWSPKAGLIWNPSPQLTLRGAFSRALGGVSYDESVRLEPTQLAGFDQSFRSVISESLVGSVEAADYQIAGGALDWKPRSNTWVTLQIQNLQERVDQDAGYLLLNFGASPLSVSAPSQDASLRYDETSASLILNQIVDRDFFLQAQYNVAHSDLLTTLGPLPAPSGFNRSVEQWGTLQQARFSASWQSPNGLFARAEALWFIQTLGPSSSYPSGGNFAQANVFGGYRFPNRRADLTFGVLNLTGGGYHLSPINYYLDLPYQRLFYTRLRFNF